MTNKRFKKKMKYHFSRKMINLKLKMKNYESVLLPCMYFEKKNLILSKFYFFLYSGIDEGRRLMANRGSLSYAAELEVLSKDEVRK